MNLSRSLVPVLAVVLASTPADAQAGARALADSARRQVLRAEAALADSVAARGLAHALPAAFAARGVYLHPAAPLLQGRDSVRAFLARQPEAALPPMHWETLHAEASADGLSAYTWGVTTTASHAPGAAVRPRLGRFIAYWTKRGGRWELDARLHAVPREAGLVVPDSAPAAPRTRFAEGEALRVAQRDLEFSTIANVSGAGKAFREFAAPDAALFGRIGELVHGPEAIGAGFESKDEWSWVPVAAGAAGSGDLAWTVGESRVGSRAANRWYWGKYLSVWKRQPDGSWLYVTDGGTARPPEPAR